MSDLENKLRSLSFREPPRDIRRQVLAAVKPRQTWRDLLWPSPLAWGAVAAVWIIAFATTESSDSRAPQPTVAQFSPTSRFLQTIELERILAQQ
jgi:hypothetical protein